MRHPRAAGIPKPVPVPVSVRIALVVLGALVHAGCTTTAPPPPAPPPPVEPAPSFDEVERQYLPKIADLSRSVEVYEARKEEIVAERLANLDRLRERLVSLREEIAAKRSSVGLVEEELQNRRERLRRIRREPAGPARESLAADVAAVVAELEEELADERTELAGSESRAAEMEAEIERLEGADDETLFLEEVRPLYREAIELHLGFYREVIDLARQELDPGAASQAFIDHLSDRAEERSRLLDQKVQPEDYATLRRELELDQRLSQAWLSAVIQKARFSLSEFRLESISEKDRSDLLFLAEALADGWSENPRLIMFIDGHADSRKFRGESACVSAAKNRELSRRRAETVAELFRESLGGEPGRIRIDYFGNFSPLIEAPDDELENRRIELRITSEQSGGGHSSHRDYFRMRDGLAFAQRIFIRRPGLWVDARCMDSTVDAEVEHLSDAHRELVERLGLDISANVSLGPDAGRQLTVHLGNAFVVEDGDRCIAVVPCPVGDVESPTSEPTDQEP